MNSKLLPSTRLYEEAKKRLEEIDLIQKRKKDVLKNAPEGCIRIVNSHKHIQYFWRTNPADRAGIYLPKSNMPRIQQLLQKAYDKRIERLINRERSALEKLLESTNGITEKIQNVYSSYPEECRNMIVPIDVTDDEYALMWQAVEYTPKEISEFQTVYRTERDELVRSKSELNIANALNQHGIPYRYECPLQLKNGRWIHPDFTVLDRKRRRTIYWEHRGMMEDREYAKHAILRIRDYERNDIFLGDGLVITEESATIPLGTSEIEEVIRHYFE